MSNTAQVSPWTTQWTTPVQQALPCGQLDVRPQGSSSNTRQPRRAGDDTRITKLAMSWHNRVLSTIHSTYYHYYLLISL